MIQPSKFENLIAIYDIIFCCLQVYLLCKFKDANKSVFLVPVTWPWALRCSWTTRLLCHDNLVNGKHSSCSFCSDVNSKLFRCKHVINIFLSDVLYTFIRFAINIHTFI
ncbi:BAD_HP_G0023190.mRNA.1.CDS.1 [Saccharomyces cerevisiae]|uniref:EC1118_1J11_2487p n=1 Tax=Saccharomyces cerevisiae (strain Lalvin EC1118 / Prise de mousse) TaxID=643680 RepID=C8ZBK2_YEAS8|nr:hypothetical protein WN66_03567 [Saccharomyces cerevisiae]CAI4941006.1 BAD_HP_G0023190.mRNA.1.CDS.1 [Saccharomyces cerevisiae]CAI6552193.1 BAD_HP_G0023190.mRNA.1.CDS.1 [Saccharomyces cerevisiae]CAY80768.2 EC1118_1J11_2487p [Saccharomyces cerevisiae EC1118]